MADRDLLLEGMGKDYYIEGYGYIPTDDSIKYVMDEYMKATCLELLEYMANQTVDCRQDDNGNPIFIVGPVLRCKELTKEQLFENFL